MFGGKIVQKELAGRRRRDGEVASIELLVTLNHISCVVANSHHLLFLMLFVVWRDEILKLHVPLVNRATDIVAKRPPAG